MDPQEYDEIIRTLVRIAAHQDTINDDLRASLQAQQAMNQRIEGFIEEQRGFNARQLEINADIRTTLARLETIIARMGQQGENGRTA